MKPLNRINPVSYTHLDVYKRQTYSREKYQKKGVYLVIISNAT